MLNLDIRDKIAHILGGIHIKMINSFFQDQKDDVLLQKGCIFLSTSYLTIPFLCLFCFIDSSFGMRTSFIPILSIFFQILILKSKKYRWFETFNYSSMVLSFLLQDYISGQPLVFIILILINQPAVLLFAENSSSTRVYIPFLVTFVKCLHIYLMEEVKTFSLGKLEQSFTNLFYLIPLILIYFYAMISTLTNACHKSMISYTQLQIESKRSIEVLQNQINELKKELKSRKIFIASVVHELRNPLNSLLGNLRLLMMEIKEEKCIKTLNVCTLCGEIMLSQINNILDVTKLNTGNFALNLVPENLHKILEGAWNILAIPMQQKNLIGEIYISRNMPKYVKIDSQRISQILLNLVGNASKFVEEKGSVKLRCSWYLNGDMNSLNAPSEDYNSLNKKDHRLDFPSQNYSNNQACRAKTDPIKSRIHSSEILDENEENKTDKTTSPLLRSIKPKFLSEILLSKYINCGIENIEIESRTNKENLYSPKQKGILKIDVADTGCGIAEEAKCKLFQPFEQADSSISSKFGGTGLGLYITKQIVKAMGGEIHVFSKENVGSCFSVLLPIETSDVNLEIKREKRSKENSINLFMKKSVHGVRALILDNIENSQLMIKGYFNKLNIVTDIANNGKEALDIFKHKGPDYYNFILIDLYVSGMDGKTTCFEIRKQEKFWNVLKEVPIIIITKNFSPSENAKCLDPKGLVRAFKIYQKPIKFSNCSEIVKEVNDA